MINNRQNGRRRGRGGPQVRNGSGNGPERGNRIDNRARGNAAQLHEKYRNLARDAQTQGDRVMTEYYLQFADHYFRVLSEGRARFEEQNPNQAQRRPHQNDDFDGGFEGAGFEGEQGDENSEAEMAPRRFDREPRRETAYDDGEQPVRQNGDNGYARDGQSRDYQTRDNQPRDTQQNREYRDGQQNRDGQQGQGRGNRDNRYVRENQNNGQNGGRDDGRNGQQARDNRDNRDNRPVAEDRERQQRPPREPYQPREAAPVEAVSPPPPAVEAEAPRPRRGRPPRNPAPVVANGEGSAGEPNAQIEIDRLPPAFALEAPEAAPAPRTRRKSVSVAAVEEGEIRAVEGEPVEAAPRRRRARRDPSDDSTVAA